MSNNPPKREIPAWQRAQQPMKSEDDAPITQQPQVAEAKDNGTPGAEDATPTDGPQETTTDEPATREAPLSAEERAQQLDLVRSFLEDPGVKDEPIEKKREFLETKGIAQDMIDKELGAMSSMSASTPASMNVADFASFKEANQTPTAPPPRQQQSARTNAPPIITYPEFLEDARKPPPLITPMRVLNATYIASGIAALAYGASTFLIKPMAASMTDARHDFATHNQGKIDEFNERLSKLVSKIPEPKSATEEADNDAESVTSDPTELFHRDVGTQTSPAITPQTTKAQTEIQTTADKQNERLSIIRSHLDELLAGLQAGEQPAKDRLEAANKLRHELDTMMYRVQTANVWGAGGYGMDQKASTDAEDAIEEVKKEIRGVKGVLLSAKRFAPVGTPQGRMGT